MPSSALSRRRKVHRRLLPVCEQAKDIWAKPVLRQYTDHTVEHSRRVISLIDELTARLRGNNRLNDNEAYVLLSAALLHDVGMQCEIFYDKCFSDELFSPKELALAREDESVRETMLREHHHRIGAEWIRRELGTGCLGTDYIEDVAEVVKAHTKQNVRALTDHEEEGLPMRLRLLAALLRMADELDLDRRRVNLRELTWALIPDASKAYWWKCHYVESVGVDRLGRIKVTFRFSNEDPEQVQQIVPNLLVDELRRKMDEDQTRRVLWDYGLQLDLDQPEILESAKGPSKTPIPEPILRILLSEQEGLDRERLASQSPRITLPDTPKPETERPRRTTVPASPQSQQSILQQARNLWAHGEAQQGVRALERAAELYPNSAPVQAMLSDMFLSQGEWNKAQAAAIKALSAEPGGVLTRLTLGVSLGSRGDHAKALEHLRIADLACHSIDIPARYHARVHMAVARSLAALGDYWHALERIRSANELFSPSRTETGDEADRVLLSAAADARRAAEAMRLQDGSWDIRAPRLQAVLGRWAKTPMVRFESLTTLMEGMLLGGSSAWVDYVFECEFQLVNLAAGFLVRSDAWATTGLMAQVGPRQLRIHQLRHSNYFAGPLIEIDLPGPVRLYEWHNVRFEVKGLKLKTWIDDEPVADWVELLDLYHSGKVGFRLWGREFALYKNLSVTVTKMWVPREG